MSNLCPALQKHCMSRPTLKLGSATISLYAASSSVRAAISVSGTYLDQPSFSLAVSQLKQPLTADKQPSVDNMQVQEQHKQRRPAYALATILPEPAAGIWPLQLWLLCRQRCPHSAGLPLHPAAPRQPRLQCGCSAAHERSVCAALLWYVCFARMAAFDAHCSLLDSSLHFARIFTPACLKIQNPA